MKRLMDQYIRNEIDQDKVEIVESLASTFAQRAERYDREGSFPFENFADMRDAGYLKLTVPAMYGGDEISLYELVLLQERLAYGCGSTALAVGWHLGQVMNFRETRKWPEPLFAELCHDIVRDGAMINTFASEIASGSPSRGGIPETKAIRTDGGWRITGRKTFSSLSPILDRFVVTAYMEEEAGIGEFLVRKDTRVTIEETWDTLGMRATGSHDIVLEQVFVPDEARILTDKSIRVDDGGGWLLHIPACYMGIAFAARDFALQFCQSYKPNSLPGPIADLPTVQQTIGELEVKLRTARSVLYSCADRWDQDLTGRSQLRPELGLAKYIVTNSAIEIVDLAMRLVGGTSLSKNHPLERYYRDIRAGLYNPPMDNSVLTLLAKTALSEV